MEIAPISLSSQALFRAHNNGLYARQNASLKDLQLTHVKLEKNEQRYSTDKFCNNEEEEQVHRVKMEKPCFSNDFIVKCYNAAQQNCENINEQEEEEEKVETKRGGKRRYNSSKYCARNTTLRAMHRHQLDVLLNSFMREHRWKEAAAVLRVLLKGAPSLNNRSNEDTCRYYMVAMELLRRSLSRDDGKYEQRIKELYELWMSNLSCTRGHPEKKNMILMELAIFYFTQGNVDDACSMMKTVIEDHVFENQTRADLLYGMILYQLWYSGLPGDYKIKDFDNCVMVKSFGPAYNDDYQESVMDDSSNDHYAAVNENAKYSSRYASTSSLGNGKVFTDHKHVLPKKEFYIASTQEFYASHSTDRVEQKPGSCIPDDNLQMKSVFFAQELDTRLLPICLNHLTGDVEQICIQYRKLADDEKYREAVKHLKLALHSTKPASAALIPLIQLLLLGDHVEEAFAELESSCHTFDTALPYRLMARLLECFQSYKVNQICSYYENALKRDPICHQSLERLVQMHKLGNCSTMLMFEMITLHLDASDGKCTIWEEFSSCFLRLQNPPDCEDCSSKNQQRRQKTLYSIKIPKALLDENSRSSWKLRLKWWKKRHFSISSLPDNAAEHDHKRLCFKAACASHIYGTKHEYVVRVLKILQADNDEHVAILKNHMRDSINLFEHL